MHRFLFAALLLLLVAISMVVGAFLYVQFLLVADTPASDEALPIQSQEITGGLEESVQETATTDSASDGALVSDTSIPPTSIALSSLPLSSTQKSLLSTAGIDYDTFIITPDMIVCAEEKLGRERFSAVVGGDSPSTLETMSLLGCL